MTPKAQVISRVARTPTGDEFSVNAVIRRELPLASDTYDIVFGRLHQRMFGWQITVKRMPAQPKTPVLHREQVTRRAVEARVDELVRDIEMGTFKPS
jgi:hypothetical protein